MGLGKKDNHTHKKPEQNCTVSGYMKIIVWIVNKRVIFLNIYKYEIKYCLRLKPTRNIITIYFFPGSPKKHVNNLPD